MSPEHDAGGVPVPCVWRGQVRQPQLRGVGGGEPGPRPGHYRGEALMDLHRLRLGRRRLHRLRGDHGHLPGPLPAGGDRGGPGPAGLLRHGCQVGAGEHASLLTCYLQSHHRRRWWRGYFQRGVCQECNAEQIHSWSTDQAAIQRLTYFDDFICIIYKSVQHINT